MRPLARVGARRYLAEPLLRLGGGDQRSRGGEERPAADAEYRKFPSHRGNFTYFDRRQELTQLADEVTAVSLAMREHGLQAGRP